MVSPECYSFLFNLFACIGSHRSLPFGYGFGFTEKKGCYGKNRNNLSLIDWKKHSLGINEGPLPPFKNFGLPMEKGFPFFLPG